MPKPFYKHKLLFDENMRSRMDFPKLNEHFDIKHVGHDLRKSGISDQAVYNLAVRQNRIIITLNSLDFRELVGTKKDCGVIGIPSHMLPPQLDNKLSALVMKLKKNQLNSRFIALGNEASLFEED